MRNLVLGVIVLLVLLLGLDGIYEVKQTERAVLLRFGAVERADVQPGLHFKWPIANFLWKRFTSAPRYCAVASSGS